VEAGEAGLPRYLRGFARNLTARRQDQRQQAADGDYCLRLDAAPTGAGAGGSSTGAGHSSSSGARMRLLVSPDGSVATRCDYC
jgi:hypothetical protein